MKLKPDVGMSPSESLRLAADLVQALQRGDNDAVRFLLDARPADDAGKLILALLAAAAQMSRRLDPAHPEAAVVAFADGAQRKMAGMGLGDTWPD